MQILHLEFKNIGSFGEKLQVIEYPSNGNLVMIKGDSGVGKSTYLNITKLLLFGKADGISKNAIANRVNKNGYIKGIVKEGDKTYIIERGFQPTYLNIFKEDGTNLDMVGIKDAQSFIDNEIVKMSYTLFSNIVSLSLINFKTFLKMSPYDRREIIDRVFSLEIINHIFELIKKDIKEISSNINIDNANIFSLNATVEQGKQELENIKQNNDSSISSSIQNNINTIENHNQTLVKISEKYQEIQKVLSSYESMKQTLNTELIKKNTEYKAILKNLKLFEQDKCPTCGSSLHSQDFDEIRNKLESDKKIAEEYMSRIQVKIQEIETAKGPYLEANQKLSSASNNLNQEILKLTADNNSLKNLIKNSAEFQSIQNIINNTQENIASTKKRINENTEKINNLEILQSLFSIDGVKKQVIDNYLPRLNDEIKDTLIRLNFPYTLTFDNSFNSHLTDLGNEINTETLSMGEHKRVDLAVLCSIFKLIKRKYPTINIFALDEVLSSIDPTNSAEILKFLKEFSEEMKVNIYVISHVSMSEDLFDDCIEIFKELRFSDIRHFNTEK